MSVYWDILAAVRDNLEALADLGGAPVKIRPRPMVAKGADTLPLVLVCPRRDSWEEVVSLQFDNSMHVDYAVLVAVVVDATADQAGLRYLLDARAAIRGSLFDPLAIQADVPATFDVTYNPSPRGADTSALAANLDPSFQEFTYRAAEDRRTA